MPGDQYPDRYFEDIEVGETYEVEDARTITESDVGTYAGLTGDFHPLHVSEPYASEETPFGERIAHGNLIADVTESLVSEASRHSFSYGHDNVRFVEPVAIGDTLSAHREVVEKEHHDEDYGKVVYRYTAFNQDGETVLVDDHVMLVRKRD